MQTGRVSSGSAADVVWFGTLVAVIVGTRSPTHWRTATRHNARHQARQGISKPFRECAQSPWVLIVKSGDFPVEFDEGGGLKNRRLAARKMSTAEVLISRTLSVCGLP
jgi:hypothetical protein